MSLSGSINFLLRTDEEMGKTVMLSESLAGKGGARSRQRSAGPRPGPLEGQQAGGGVSLTSHSEGAQVHEQLGKAIGTWGPSAGPGSALGLLPGTTGA